jgi:hypothetical protein
LVRFLFRCFFSLTPSELIACEALPFSVARAGRLKD